MYAAIQFSKPFAKVELFEDGKPIPTRLPVRALKNKNLIAAIHFKTTAGEQSPDQDPASPAPATAGAANNLKTEIPAWDFAQRPVRRRSRLARSTGQN